MERREPALAQRRAVVDARITGVVLPAVSRVLTGELRHEAIAGHLRDDRGRRDREAFRVALHDLAVLAWGEGRIDDAPSVDEHPVVITDLAQRTHHGDVARVVDVQPMDLTHRGGSDTDAHDSRANEESELLALDAGEHLRILHRTDELRIGCDQARRSDHWTGEGGHAD